MKALSIAVWIEVSFALGMRVKWRRWRVESTRAMLKSAPRGGEVSDGARVLGLCGMVEEEIVPMPSSLAFCSAASEAMRAASSESMGTCLVAMAGLANVGELRRRSYGGFNGLHGRLCCYKG